MRQRRWIICIAVCVSFICSFIYYCLFTMIQPKVEEMTIYMIQVGLYEKSNSIDKMRQSLKEDGFTSYTLKNGDKTAVIVGLTQEKEELTTILEQLKDKSYSYVEKSVTLQDEEVISLMKQEAYEKVLERIET